MLTMDRVMGIVWWGIPSIMASWVLHIVLALQWQALFVTMWMVSAIVYYITSLITVTPVGKAVVVTGCDTGFGHALALHLDKLGFRVFAGCLLAESGGEGAELLRKKGSERLHVLQLDVTSETQQKAALQYVKTHLEGNEVLWGVVNNAGLSSYGEVEWVPLSLYKRTSDVNIFGLVSTTKTFLPLIRRAKGRVINIASMYGRMSKPMRSSYVISKYAVEGFSDCLRQEMKRWGVKVCVVEPGNFVAATCMYTDETVKKMRDDLWEAMDDDVQSDYGEMYFRQKTDEMISFTKAGTRDMTPVVSALTEAVTKKFPQARYLPMDLKYRFRVFVYTHLPEWFFDSLAGR